MVRPARFPTAARCLLALAGIAGVLIAWRGLLDARPGGGRRAAALPPNMAPGDGRAASPVREREAAAPPTVARPPLPLEPPTAVRASSGASVWIRFEGVPAAGAEAIVLPWTPEVASAARSLAGIPRSALERLALRRTADADGSVLVGEAPPFFVAALAPGSAPAGVLVEAADGLAVLDLPQEERVEGRVVDDPGRPVADTVVRGSRAIFEEATQGDRIPSTAERIAGMLFESATTCRADGSFELGGLPRARVALTARRAERESARDFQSILPTEDTIVLALRSVRRVSGVVIAKETGTPIEGARVSSWNRDGELSIHEEVAAETDAEGGFSLDVPALEDPAHLRFQADGFGIALFDIGSNAHPWDDRLLVALQRACPIRGTARSTAGPPLYRAWIQTQQPGTLDLLAYTQADADGRFTLDGIAPGTDAVLAIAAANHYRTLWHDLDLCAASPLELAAEPMEALSGRARVDRLPLRGAKARLVREENNGYRAFEASVPVDPDTGTFLFEGLVPAFYQLDVTAPGYAPARAFPVSVAATAGLQQVEVELREGREIRGQVVERLTGRPIPGARVALGDENTLGKLVGTLPEGPSTVTDLLGRFRLQHAPADHGICLFVQHEDFAQGSQRLEAATELRAIDVTLPLRRAASIRARILDEAGEPLRKVIIFARCSDGSERVVESDAGEALLGGLPGGRTEVQVTVGPATRRDLDNRIFKRFVDLVDGESVVFVDSLRGGGSVVGTVTGLDYFATVSTIWVSSCLDTPAAAAAGSDADDHVALVDERGAYALQGLSPGNRILKLKCVDSSKSFQIHRRIAVEEGKDQRVDFELLDTSLTGRISGPDGRPLAAARILSLRVSSPDPALSSTPPELRETRSDGEGGFVMASVEPGEHVLAVELAGYGTVDTTFSIADEHARVDADLVLQPEGRLEVRVVDRSGQAIAEASCTAARADRAALRPLPAEAGGTPGSFVFSRAATGLFRVAAEAPGFFAREQDARCGNGSVTRIDLALRRICRLSIRVEAPGGAGVPFAPVALTDIETAASAAVWLGANRIATSTGKLETDGDGRLCITGLPEGAYRVAGQGFDVELLVVPGDSGAVETIARLE